MTSFIEMLEILNFGHMITPTKLVDQRDKVWLVTSWTVNFNVIKIISKYLYFKKA